MSNESHWRNYYWKIWLKVEDLKAAIGSRCFHCNTRGSKKNQMEFAHLQPTGLNGIGRGSHHRRLDVLKHQDKYTYLCRNCHQDLDKGRSNITAISIVDKLKKGES